LAGMAVGRDIGGTMVLTLVFAMLGALLPALLYPWAAGASAAEALNGEAGAMLITRALVCGIGMLVAVPATAACAAWLMPGHVRPVRRPARREWLIGRGLVGLEVVALILLLVGAPEGRPPATTGALELDRELEAIDTADRGLEAARDRLAEGRLDAAILTLWRAATRDPSRVLVQMQLGHAYSVRGWPAQATTAVERAAELDPGDGRIHQFLGRLYEGQGRHALAVEAFLRAAALNRDDVDVLCDLATAYSGVDDFDSAERITRRAAALAPTHPRVRQLLDALDIDRP